jgi:pyruvate, water dikinase
VKIWQRLRNLCTRKGRHSQELIDLPVIFEHFQEILANNQRAMEIITDLGEKTGGEYIFDRQYLADAVKRLQDALLRLVKGLNLVAGNRYTNLYQTLDRIFLPLEAELRGRLSLAAEAPLVCSLTDLPLDHPEMAGGKASNVAEIRRRLDMPVPDGFVITIKAYRRYLEHNQLEERIHGILENWQSGQGDERQTSRQIHYNMLAGAVPSDVSRAIRSQVDGSKKGIPWIVRSSAYGEDGELSFAGLHKSLVNVAGKNLLSAYKEVLASLYNPEALIYRQSMGILGEEAAMAVLCQEMIPARISGVAHSRALEVSAPDQVMIYAAPGLGRVVKGRGQVQRVLVHCDSPHEITWLVDNQATRKPVSKKAGGLAPAGKTENQWPDLFPDAVVRQLATWVSIIERYFKRAQEIEWAVDSQGKLWILQCRNLHLPEVELPNLEEVCDSCAAQPVMVRELGSVAHAGVGAGPVFKVRSDEDMGRFPEGAIMVTPFTAPWLARIVPKASGIIAERGSAAGHLATIAREFRVPALVGVVDAMKMFAEGEEITLDTYNRCVYRGQVQALLNYELMHSLVFEDSAEFRLLRRLLKRIAPLGLTDPQASNFTPDGCTSVHDVVRFIHEKAVQELMDIPKSLSRPSGVQVWTLVSAVPLDLKVLDLGGGIDPEATGSKITLEQVRSLPLRALWEVLNRPGVWSTEPIPVDFQGMMSSLTRTMAESPGMETGSGIDLAVISGSYLNLHLRLGYHFNLVDARMEDDPIHNHIYFRFLGGVTDITRRSRRAQLLARILSRCHFKVDVKGDLVIARVLHLTAEEIEARLGMLGRLIGFTRQLDVQLRSDEDVDRFENTFFPQSSPNGKCEAEGGQHGTAAIENNGPGR